jgi:hypothetical protein
MPSWTIFIHGGSAHKTRASTSPKMPPMWQSSRDNPTSLCSCPFSRQIWQEVLSWLRLVDHPQVKPTSLIGGMPQHNTPRSRCTRGRRLRRCWCHGCLEASQWLCVWGSATLNSRPVCQNQRRSKNLGYCMRKRAQRCVANKLGCLLNSPICNTLCVNLLGGV